MTINQNLSMCLLTPLVKGFLGLDSYAKLTHKETIEQLAPIQPQIGVAIESRTERGITGREHFKNRVEIRRKEFTTGLRSAAFKFKVDEWKSWRSDIS